MTDKCGKYAFNAEENKTRKALVVGRVAKFLEEMRLSTDDMQEILDIIDKAEANMKGDIAK